MENSKGVPVKTLLDESIAVARRLLKIEASAVQALENRVDESFAKAIQLIAAIPGRVIVTGMGKSGHIGRKISATLASTGTPSHFLHPTEAAHGDLGMVTRQDAVIILSKSGETDDLLQLMPYFKLLKIPVIGFIGRTDGSLAEQCDAVIDVSVVEEGCPLDLAPTASTTAALAMGDAMAVALLTLKRFRPEDFAFLHPGGALGRRLGMRVEEIMHTQDRIPMVAPEASLRELIMEMTQKRLGATCIVGPDHQLQGIFTDGDLRRAFERNIDLQPMKAGQLAIRNPKTINPQDLVTRAINLMETYNVLVMPVVDDFGILIGIVHLHDLLKSGIGR
jgi:arabinose-5-phosphate isomerase